MSGSELLVLTRSEYKAMDYFHQAIADVGVRKGLVVIVEEDEREGVANPARVLRSQTEPDQNLRLHQPGGALTLLIPRDA